MKGPVQVWRDPGVSVGPYRILPKTTGGFVVFDDRRRLGENEVGWGPTVPDAEREARALLGLNARPTS